MTVIEYNDDSWWLVVADDKFWPVHYRMCFFECKTQCKSVLMTFLEAVPDKTWLVQWEDMIRSIGSLAKNLVGIFENMNMLCYIFILINIVVCKKDYERHHRVGYSLYISNDSTKISVSSWFFGNIKILIFYIWL